ncbi:MAG TPA: hypothetical protein VFF76_03470 [Holophagaceae bacterium]|jgi:hypothetical protein|nr:hypothetical protein [Holophagaceae bacterium]
MTDFLHAFLQNLAHLLALRADRIFGLAVWAVILFALLRILKWQSRRIEARWTRSYPSMEDAWLAEPIEEVILAIIINGPSWWWNRILYPGAKAALRPGTQALHVIAPSNTPGSEMRGGRSSIPWNAIRLDPETGVAHLSSHGQDMAKLKLSPTGAHHLKAWLEAHS